MAGGKITHPNKSHPFSPDKQISVFRSRIRITPYGCHMWQAARGPGGYGAAWFMGKLWPAHRVAWYLDNGEIPSGMVVMHKCDNPPCCNPEHLKLGTHKDNVHDKESKGRADRNNPARGEKIGSSILTDEKVIQIRRLRRDMKMSYKEIANIFSIKTDHVGDVCTRRSWRHLQ